MQAGMSQVLLNVELITDSAAMHQAQPSMLALPLVDSDCICHLLTVRTLNGRRHGAGGLHGASTP